MRVLAFQQQQEHNQREQRERERERERERGGERGGTTLFPPSLSLPPPSLFAPAYMPKVPIPSTSNSSPCAKIPPRSSTANKSTMSLLVLVVVLDVVLVIVRVVVLVIVRVVVFAVLLFFVCRRLDLQKPP